MDSNPVGKDASLPTGQSRASAEGRSARNGTSPGHIIITGASITGTHVAIGDHAQIQVTMVISPQGKPALDRAALKQSLEDLYLHLGAMGLPTEVLIEARAATAQARNTLRETGLNVEALVGSLKQLGNLLQNAGIKVEPDSALATALRKVATLSGPLIAGGERIVVAWFGLPQL